MSIKLAILSLVTTLNLSLAVLVYVKNPSRWVNKTFTVFTLAVAGWTTGTYFGITYADTARGLFGARTAFAMGGLCVYTLLVFLHVFPSSSTLPRSIPVRGLGALAAILTLAALTTPWIVTTTTIEASSLKVLYGPLYPLFAGYILACVGYSFFVIIRRIHTARGMERLQLRYLFMGLLVPGLLATVTNLLIPLAFETSQFSQYGPLFSFLMIAMIAHAIIRHRLMNIRLVVRRSVGYLITVLVSGGVFVALVGLASTLIASRPRDIPLWMEVGLVLLIALLFQPLNRWIQAALDRYLYREPYNYQRTILEASRTIATMLDLHSLLNYVIEVIGRTIRPERVLVYMKDSEIQSYRLLARKQFIEANDILEFETVANDSPLPGLLTSKKAYLLGDDLKRVDSQKETRLALDDLARLGGEFVQPISVERHPTGLLVVGPKLSGDPYFSEDIDLLTTLVSQAGIAIRNAQLYRQVILVNEYIESILATMESGVIAVDSDGTVTLFNSAAERMTRLDAQDVTARTAENLPTSLAAPLQATLADGQSRPQVETTIEHASGHLTPVICSTSPLHDRSRMILGAVAVFSDLTRLKELEAEKRRAERLASIGALASGIAHEIKNPLVAIKTFAELLPERFTDEDFQGDFSRVVIREIERIDDLVARLRGLATYPAEPLTQLDLRSPIEETLALLRAQLEQARITVKKVFDLDPPLVVGDPAQLKQLFLNLFMNAMEAMEPGGQLAIHLIARELFESQTVVVEIKDTGVGIPEHLLGKIFDPFVTTKPRGSGLGLSICRGIADAHRATIRVQNNLGDPGITVVIEFPAVHEVAASLR